MGLSESSRRENDLDGQIACFNTLLNYYGNYEALAAILKAAQLNYDYLSTHTSLCGSYSRTKLLDRFIRCKQELEVIRAVQTINR